MSSPIPLTEMTFSEYRGKTGLRPSRSISPLSIERNDPTSDNQHAAQQTSGAHTSLLDDSSEDARGADKPSLQSELSKSGKVNLDGAFTKIAIAGIATTVPFLVCVVAMMTIIFRYQVGKTVSRLNFSGQPAPADTPRIRPSNFTDVDDPSVYLVDYSATRLATVASWTSTIAAVMPGFVMTLLSFQVANRMLKECKSASQEHLLTPYQLGLLLESFQGGPMAVWNGLNYVLWKRRNKLNRMLRLAFSGLTIGLLLSLIIWAVDTWFHIAVSTVPFTQITPYHNDLKDYGTQLNRDCVGFLDRMGQDKDERYHNCWLDSDGSQGSEAYDIVNNVSVSGRRIRQGGFGGSQFSMLTTPYPDDTDFKTSTVAASASCEPITQRCGLNPDVEGVCEVKFDCSSNFRGTFNLDPDLANSTMSLTNTTTRLDENGNGCLATFANSSMIDAVSYNSSLYDTITGTGLDVIRNPYYIAVAGHVDQTLGFRSLIDGQNVIDECQSKVFVLGCEITLYDVNYTWVNDSMEVTGATPSNANTAFFSLVAFANRRYFTQLSYATIVATSQSSEPENLALNFGKKLEQTVLAFSSRMFEDANNTQRQLRKTILVSRVPKAPLFTLIGLCLLFVLLGIALLLAAIIGQRSDVRNVQGRLNIYGVMAGYFENPERTSAPVTTLKDMFDEHEGDGLSKRVRISPTEKGGWAYTSSRE